MGRPVCEWQGASGRHYDYIVHTLEEAGQIGAGQFGNCIYARINDERLWVPVCIGQGDLGVEADLERHRCADCLRLHGATHVHLHANTRPGDRRAEEGDLRANYPMACECDRCSGD